MVLNLKNKKIFQKGFSLIELIVAVSIFSVICVIAMGALYSVQNINTKTQQTQTILDGMNFSMEEMARDIRYGSIFNCSNNTSGFASLTGRVDCVYPGSFGSTLVFRPAGTTGIARNAYYLSGGHIMKWDSITAVSSQVTSDDVNIKALHFFIEGSGDVLTNNDYEQPIITIVISGVTVPPKSTVLPVKFNLETSVSARPLDN